MSKSSSPSNSVVFNRLAARALLRDFDFADGALSATDKDQKITRQELEAAVVNAAAGSDLKELGEELLRDEEAFDVFDSASSRDGKISRTDLSVYLRATDPTNAQPGNEITAWTPLKTVPYPGKQDDLFFVNPYLGWY